jgi:ribosomal protein L37AE/L43A
MGLLSGEPNRQKRAEELRKPVKVPSKGARRQIARVRNGVRRARRVRHKVGQRVGSVGAVYRCSICEAEVPVRRAEAHNWQHRVARENARNFKKRQEQARRDAPPLPRDPSQTKQKAAAGSSKKLAGLKDPSTGKKIKKVDKRRKYRRESDAIGDDMAGRTRRPSNGTPASQHAAAVAELRAHLMSMDAALGQAVGPLNGFAARMVQRRIHPVIAQPIDQAAEALGGIRHYFTEAYSRFERIYADRLAHERNQEYKPDDSLFGDVG